MKKVKLSRGKIAFIDDEDFDLVSQIRPWHCTTIGYAAHSRTSGSKVWMHRLIMGATKGVEVDHINGNKLDNRKSNLRLCSTDENRLNRRSYKTKVGSSKFKGVSFKKQSKKFVAQIQYEGAKVHIGYFTDETEAARAYNLKAAELFGKFAYLNNV